MTSLVMTGGAAAGDGAGGGPGVDPRAPETAGRGGLWAPVVVVLGASGGVGASTWAAALARRLSLHLGECVLVDGCPAAGGLDLSCGTEHVPGLRWPDLARLRGAVSCSRLVGALPAADVPVLSADGRGGDVPDSVVTDVLESLRGEVPVVVDARIGPAWVDGLLRAADVVHVVSGLRVRQVADTQAVLGRVTRLRGADGVDRAGELAPVRLLTRGERAADAALEELVEQLDLPHLGHLRDDAKVRRAGERGDWPGLRGALRDTADRVVLDLLDLLKRLDVEEARRAGGDGRRGAA